MQCANLKVLLIIIFKMFGQYFLYTLHLTQYESRKMEYSLYFIHSRGSTGEHE